MSVADGINSSTGTAPAKMYVFASPTTIYLNVRSAYTGGQTQFYGRLSGTKGAL